MQYPYLISSLQTASLSLLLLVMTAGCGRKSASSGETEAAAQPSEVLLADSQMQRLSVTVGSLEQHPFEGAVEVTGQIACDAKSKASVTSYVGANIQSILVTEGQQVAKGQPLAWISHPDLISLQTQYLSAYNRLQYLSKDYQRQQRLYKEKVGSGKNFQKTESDYKSLLGEVRGLESQMRLLGISVKTVRNGRTVSRIAIVSPISGTVERILAEMGQYADPQTPLFHIVNTQNVYADLLVYEKDLTKVRAGQTVKLQTTSSDDAFEARIYNVGSQFESTPKAVHARAKLLQRPSGLTDGMYLKGTILTDHALLTSLPDEAIAEDGGSYFAFAAQHTAKGWAFKPVAVERGRQEGGYTQVSFKSAQPASARYATSGAYYLMSELKKSETGEE